MLYEQLVSGEARLTRERWFDIFRELVTLNRFHHRRTEDGHVLVALRHKDNPLIVDLDADNTNNDVSNVIGALYTGRPSSL